MEDSLPHTAPVLHVPTVLCVELRVSLRTVALGQLGQDLGPGVPEGGGVGQLPHEGELLRGGSDGVPDAGDVGAVDPGPLAAVVEVGRELLLDCLVQLLVVLGDHGLLTHLIQHSRPGLTQILQIYTGELICTYT